MFLLVAASTSLTTVAGAGEDAVITGLDQRGDAGKPGLLVGRAGIQGDENTLVIFGIGSLCGLVEFLNALGIGQPIFLLETLQNGLGDLNVLGVAGGGQRGGNKEALTAVLTGIFLQPSGIK